MPASRSRGLRGGELGDLHRSRTTGTVYWASLRLIRRPDTPRVRNPPWGRIATMERSWYDCLHLSLSMVGSTACARTPSSSGSAARLRHRRAITRRCSGERSTRISDRLYPCADAGPRAQGWNAPEVGRVRAHGRRKVPAHPAGPQASRQEHPSGQPFVDFGRENPETVQGEA